MTGRVYYFILFLFSLVAVERASAQAIFTGGATQSLTVCQDAGAVAINDLLAANDTNVGVTVNWTVLQTAAHGVLVATYTTTSAGTTLTPTGLTYTPTTGYSGNDSFKVQVSDGIDSTTTMVYLTILPLPSAGVITGLSTVCTGNTITLSTTGSGGAWSASNANATVNSSGEVTGVTAGTVDISYALSNICGTSSATHNVTVNAAPASNTISGATEVCAGSSTSLTTTGTGGIWASSSTGVATVNSFGVVSGVSTGTATISYTVTNSCGTTTATQVMTVSVMPTAGTLSGASTVCQTGAIAVFSTVPGGLWTSSTPTIANVGSSSGIVTGVSGGTATLSYTVSNACGTNTSTKPVTVNPLPSIAPITGITTICGGIPSTLNDTTTGGTWSSANPSIASVSSTGVVSGVSTGTTVISYSKSNSCGTNAATVIVHVGPPAAGAILGSHTVCQGTATTTLTTTSVGGTWSSSNMAVGTVYPLLDGNVVIGGVSAGVTNISYTVVGTCSTSVATFVVSVEAGPTPSPISGTPVVCQYATTTLSGAVSGGTWATSDSSVGYVAFYIPGSGIVTGVAGGTVNISYTVTNACGTLTAVKQVTVNTTPPISPIVTSTTHLCEADTMTVYNDSLGGVWTSYNTGIATVIPTVSAIGSGGYITGIAAGVDTIYYTRTNSCGPSSAKLILIVDSLPAPGVIIGTGEFCKDASSLFTPSRPGGVWSSSLTSVATVSGTGLVTGVGGGTSIISYHRTNGCGTSAAVAIVTVDPLPVAGAIGGGVLAICPGHVSPAFTAAPAGGVWSVGAGGASSISPSGVFTAVTSGTPTISYTVTNLCGSATSTKTITVRTIAECLAETPDLALANGAELRLFPNPGNGTVNVMLASATDEEVLVAITNVAGQKVKEFTTVTNKETSMQMDVPAGIYFLSARTANGGYYSAKMVITQ